MRLLFRLLILFLSPFCGGVAHANQTPSPVLGEIIFDCYHVNFAWGYRLDGFYIDKNGKIFKYNRNGDPWLPDSVKQGGMVYPESDLYDKYKNKQLIGNVEQQYLQSKIVLIQKAARGKLSRRHTGNDAGASGCVAYLFSPEKKEYREIRLGSSGDYEEINSSSAAHELFKWLKQFWR